MRRSLRRRIGTAILTAGIAVLLLGGLKAVKEIRRHNEAVGKRAAFYREAAAREKEWILKNQTPAGAFVTYEMKTGGDGGPAENEMNPYFANIAAMALLEGAPSEHEKEAVRRYLDWYLEHQNGDAAGPDGPGAICDHIVYLWEDGRERAASKGTYDSADSYAGTFLSLCAAYVRETGDRAWLAGKWMRVERVVDALLACMDEKGFFTAKAQHPVRYLMDNCEAGTGLESALYLLEESGEDGGRARAASEGLLKNRELIRGEFYNSAEKRFEVGFDEDGNVLPFRGWDYFYADSVAQVFPVVWAAVEPDEALALQIYGRFCDGWKWEEMDYRGEENGVFYWTVLAYAGARMQDEDRVEKFFLRYQKETEKSRAYPLHIDDAGWMAMAACSMSRYYEGKIIPFFGSEE